MAMLNDLIDADLEAVMGGMDPNYKECGGGLVPFYIPCMNLYEIYQACANLGQQLHNQYHPPK